MIETDSIMAPEDGDVPAVSDVARLRHYLADQDIVCPGCGYNLRGLQTDACPECDQRLELVIRRADARTGILMLTLVGLAIGAGGAGMFVVPWVTYALIWGRSIPGPSDLLKVFSVGFAVATISLLALTRRRCRAWFERMNRSVQITLAILAWAIPVAFITIIALRMARP